MYRILQVFNFLMNVLFALEIPSAHFGKFHPFVALLNLYYCTDEVRFSKFYRSVSILYGRAKMSS
jgi:hypothetical protein